MKLAAAAEEVLHAKGRDRRGAHKRNDELRGKKNLKAVKMG